MGAEGAGSRADRVREYLTRMWSAPRFDCSRERHKIPRGVRGDGFTAKSPGSSRKRSSTLPAEVTDMEAERLALGLA